MDEGLKMVIAVTGVAVAFPLAIIGSETPEYIPSNRLAALAARADGPSFGRAAMVDELARCRRGRHGRVRVPLDRLGAYPLHSWQNDAGYFATTRVRCVQGRGCTVAAAAWVAHPLPGTRCTDLPALR